MAMDRRDTLGQVTLDPATHECQIDYRIGINLEDKMAVPKGKRQLPCFRDHPARAMCLIDPDIRPPGS